MREKKPTWDARDVAAIVFAAITGTIALLYPVVGPVATIANGLAIALALRARARVDGRDLLAIAVAGGAAVLVAVLPHSTTPMVTILNGLVIALVLRRRG